MLTGIGKRLMTLPKAVKARPSMIGFTRICTVKKAMRSMPDIGTGARVRQFLTGVSPKNGKCWSNSNSRKFNAH